MLPYGRMSSIPRIPALSRLIASGLITSVLIASTLLSGCGNRGDPRELQLTGYRDIRLAANLMQELADLESHPANEPCDRMQSKIKHELLSAIQKPREGWDTPRRAPDHPEHRIAFQGSFLVDVPKRVPESKEWSSFIFGWERLYQFYLKNRDHPEPRIWAKMNALGRSLLLEDKRRILGRRNYGIHRENLPFLPEIFSAFDACQKDSSCSRPSLQPKIELAARSIPYYKMFIEQLESEGSPEARRALFPKIMDRLKADLETFSFRPNPALRSSVVGGLHQLTLEIDAGQLSENEQTLLSRIVESIWAGSRAKVSILWKKSKEALDLFRVLFDPKRPGERPYVIRSEKTVNLFPGTRTRSIAHEFGHVLGFADHYFTTWDPIQCQYVEESDPLDLMSDSSSGDVTDEEWQNLLGEPTPSHSG